MFQALIFDFDGVILDSEPLHYEACSFVFKQLGLALSYEEYVEKYLGLSDKEMFPKVLSAKNFNLSLDKINALIEEKTKHYQEIVRLCDSLPMIDSVDRYIEYISQKIPKLAICSGSTRNEIRAVLTKLKQGRLQSYFNTIITSEDVQQGKPSPEGYLLTAKQLNVPPSECLVIEDTPHGVDAAKAAGMQAIAILTSYKKDQFQHADKVITNFNQLIVEEVY
ncbi:Phosphorylated carbohydrates phosphatase [Legionella massiliensis]|uniref:Phosphorylated carbohydrates phosphatase n=1 Tax=Legionella massiliensis TaxID=1034943 RepID=A0A078KT52_9GAMM|nr:HAD family phosphatase [Legionella massiliensis]CDZ76137.1 Phosphorylated carbohydrates phosphatase [Legionella massiliensis]CEE11875.1 Phosphorylated carbohydrates phosphatase [Legionella massiliensis]